MDVFETWSNSGKNYYLVTKVEKEAHITQRANLSHMSQQKRGIVEHVLRIGEDTIKTCEDILKDIKAHIRSNRNIQIHKVLLREDHDITSTSGRVCGWLHTQSLRHWRTLCPIITAGPCRPHCPKVRNSLENAVVAIRKMARNADLCGVCLNNRLLIKSCLACGSRSLGRVAGKGTNHVCTEQGGSKKIKSGFIREVGSADKRKR